MTSALLVPTVDHVVVNVRDRIDEGAETYRRLGFTLTPRGYHTLGSMNHLAMFGTDYLELIAAPPGDTRRPEILSAPEGLNGLVFGSEDAAATYFALRSAGVSVQPPQQFSRPVALEDGTRDAAFRTVALTPGTVPAGRLYFCQHLTRDLVWRDEWRHHANGVTSVAGAVIAAEDPAVMTGLFARMFGDDAVVPIDGGHALVVGMARFDVLPFEALAARYGDAAPARDGRATVLAGLVLHTKSIAMARGALREGGIAGVQDIAGRLAVPASSAFGAMLVFEGA